MSNLPNSEKMFKQMIDKLKSKESEEEKEYQRLQEAGAFSNGSGGKIPIHYSRDEKPK